MATRKDIGVCSWSLAPDALDDLIERVGRVGVTAVQLALEPIRQHPDRWLDARAKLASHGIEVLSGMFQSAGEDYTTPQTIRETGGVVPDATWEETWRRVEEVAAIAKALAIDTVSFHAGFIPEGGGQATVTERVRRIADRFAADGATVLLETGQETATTLSAFLTTLDRKNVGVNFDPANMLLYDMGDPLESLRRLLPHVRQVHLKDAHPPAVHGEWGTEVVLGTGAVDWRGFLTILTDAAFAGPMVIEREAGEDREGDARTAARFVTATLAALQGADG